MTRKRQQSTQKWEPHPHWKILPDQKIFLLPIGPSHSHKLPPQQLQQSANNVQISTLDSKQNLAIWYHRICFSPVVTTWIKAINTGFFSTWPVLTSKHITKHLPPQSIMPRVTSANNTRTPGPPKQLRPLSSRAPSINKQTMRLYPSNPLTQSSHTKQARSPSFLAEDTAT